MSKTLHSWGHYPFCKQHSRLLHWRDEVSSTLNTLRLSNKTTLAFGKGRSYGDSCHAASQFVLETKNLDKWISADWEKGIITAESGVTLENILQLAIPQGWFLPVTPGTQFVTLGGAIANDVHGKNHHVRGTFGLHVVEFGLARSDRIFMKCSKEENSDFFSATIGGLGLTGIITWVKLQLMPIQSSLIDVMQIRFNNIHEFFSLSSELDHSYEYSVAWIDCLAKKNALGRGILSVGNHTKNGVLRTSNKRKFKVPFTPAVSLMNNLSVKIFNQLYFAAHSNKKYSIDYDTFFYPLDSILDWNKIYGPKGFQQYQCVIPLNHAEAVLKDILNAITNSNKGSFLSVMKRCGNIKSPGLLSFPIPGISFALDFSENYSHHQKLFEYLDAIVHETGGRLYPAKDAHMAGNDFRKAYPHWQQLELMRDPALLSTFWKRVTQT